jgi:hypothetical protein
LIREPDYFYRAFPQSGQSGFPRPFVESRVSGSDPLRVERTA